MELGVEVRVFRGVGVSIGLGVGDAGTCNRAGLTLVETIPFVGVDVLIAGAVEPTKLHDIIINANIPTKNIRSLLGLGCLFIFYIPIKLRLVAFQRSLDRFLEYIKRLRTFD